MPIVGVEVEDPDADLDSIRELVWGQAGDLVGRTGDAFLELIEELGDGRYRTTIGTQVVAGTAPPEGMVSGFVHGARWLHERHQRPEGDIEGTFRRMFDWLTDEGIHADGARLTIGYGVDGPFDLYVRVTP